MASDWYRLQPRKMPARKSSAANSTSTQPTQESAAANAGAAATHSLTSLVDAQTLASHLPQLAPVFGKQGHLSSIEQVDLATLFANLKIPFEIGDMACAETLRGVAFKNAGKSDLKVDLAGYQDAVTAFHTKLAVAMKGQLESCAPEDNELCKTILDLQDSENFDQQIQEYLLSWMTIDGDAITGHKELATGLPIGMDDHAGVEMMTISFFPNVRVLEVSEHKGQFQSAPAKMFSNSSNIATDLNVGYVRGQLGLKFTLTDDKIVLTPTLTAGLIVLSKSDARVMAEMDEVEAALRAAGRKTAVGGASGGSSGGAPAAKKPKFTLGKKK